MPNPDQPLPAEVQAALQRGQVIEAIKLLRESTGLGLKEAKDRVDAHMRATATVPAAGLSSGALPPVVTQALLEGRKIEAIRLLREQTGWGLKEAKEAVEASRIEKRLAPGEVPGDSSRLAWLVVVALLALAAYYAVGSFR